MTVRSPRRLLWVLLGLWFAAGCRPGAADLRQPGTCDGPQPGPCARALKQAHEDADAPALRQRAARYVALRKAADAGDAWAQLFARLQQQRQALPAEAPAVVVVADRAAAARVTASAAAAQVAVVVQDLPAPAPLSAAELLLLLGEAAGFEHLVWVRDDAAYHLFPDDPLRPFVGGIPAFVRADDTLDRLAAMVRLGQTLRAALRAASAWHYVEAAALADRLSDQTGSDPSPSEPALRALYALQLLHGAGVIPDRDTPRPAFQAPESFPQSQKDTPYADLLRVRLVASKSHLAEWRRRRANILTAVAADRRDDLDDLMAPPPVCRIQRVLPTESVRDLIYAERLPGALATGDGPQKPAELAPAEWLRRYRRLVELSVATGTAWSYLPTLLRERGKAAGAADPVYAKVTELALTHLRACLELQQSAPLGFPLFSQLGLLYSAGVRSDPAVYKALLGLSDIALKGRLSPPATAESMLSGVITAVLSGMFFPEDARGSYMRSLHDAISARLRDDLMRQTGWSVAALYALDELYRRLAGLPSELALDTHHFVRALQDPAVAYPELAALAQATVLYAGLLVNNSIDVTQVGEPDRFSPEHRDAYTFLRQALQTLGAREIAGGPAHAVDDFALFIDGLFAVLSASLHGDSRERNACASESPPASPELQAALARLRQLRQRLLATAPASATPAQLRARLLLQITSDLFDLGSRDKDHPSYAISAATAETNLRDGLRTWPLGAGAALLATGYGALRAYLIQPADSRKLALGPEQTRALVRAVQDFTTASVRAGNKSKTLAALGAVDWTRLTGDNAAQLAAALSQELYGQQQQQIAGAMLLTAALLDSSDGAATASVLRTAARYDRPLVAATRYFIDTFAYRQGRAPDPSAYASALQSDAEQDCQGPGTGQTLAVLQAASDFARGKTARARASLHAWLRSAEESGLTVPRVTYQYEEKIDKTTLQLSYILSYGTGILSGERSFSLGLGSSTVPAWESKFARTFATNQGDKADVEAQRYYVYAASLLAVYELLDGSPQVAERVAAQALAAGEDEVRLGNRPPIRGSHNLYQDAHGVLAVAAQLAAEAGLPVLAGQLWRVVNESLGDADSEDTVLAMLSPLPTGLAGVPRLAPLLERVRGSLKKLARELPCARHGRPTPAPVEVSCRDYPLALSLYLGSERQPQPRLAGADAASCGYWPAMQKLVDVNTSPAAQRQAQFTAALGALVPSLLSAGHPVEAGYLLRRHPACDKSLLPLERRAGAADVPAAVAIWLVRDAISCADVMSRDPQIDVDLLQLDVLSRKLPGDPFHFKVVTALLYRTRQSGDWTALRKLAEAADFNSRLDPGSTGSEPALVGLLIQHLLPASAGQPPPLQRLAITYQLGCRTFPDSETSATRRSLCAELQRWQQPPAGTPSAAALRTRADESLSALSAQLAH